MPAWLRPPDTGSPEVLTLTWVSVPPAAVAVIPADGSASLAPFPGVIVTRGAAFAAPLPVVAPAPPWAGALAWLVLCPPPVHPAASSVSTATAANPAGLLTRRPRVVTIRTALTSAPVPHTCVLYTRPTAPAAYCHLLDTGRQALVAGWMGRAIPARPPRAPPRT